MISIAPRITVHTLRKKISGVEEYTILVAHAKAGYDWEADGLVARPGTTCVAVDWGAVRSDSLSSERCAQDASVVLVWIPPGRTMSAGWTCAPMTWIHHEATRPDSLDASTVSEQ
jgi:hypothetical protein